MVLGVDIGWAARGGKNQCHAFAVRTLRHYWSKQLEQQDARVSVTYYSAVWRKKERKGPQHPPPLSES